MRFIITTLILLYHCSLSAQLRIDVMSGLSVSNVEFQNSEVDFEFDPVTYYCGGLSVRYLVLDRVAMELSNELGFRGYSTTGTSKLRYRRMYWDIIPSISISPLDGLELDLGFYYGLLLRNEYKGIENEYRDLSHLEVVKDVDSGIMAQINYFFNRIGVWCAYKHGIANIDNVLYHNIHGQSIGEVEHKNREVQFGISYRILK